MFGECKYLVYVGKVIFRFDLFSIRSSNLLTNVEMFIPRTKLFGQYNNVYSIFSHLKYRSFHNKSRSIKRIVCDLRPLSTDANISRPSEKLEKVYINSSQTEGLKKIAEAFQCSSEDAYMLMKLNKTLLKQKTSLQKVKIFQKYGLSVNTIRENIWILKYSESELKHRVEQLRKWNLDDLNSGVNFLKLPFMELLNYTFLAVKDQKFLNGKNRIQYFAELLKCSESQVCDTFLKHKFLLNMTLKLLLTKLHLHLDAGILPEHVLADVNNFLYSSKWISNQIKEIKRKNNFDKTETVMKPWMLRCLRPVLDRTLELQMLNKEATLPYSNWGEFLCKELDISATEVEVMVHKHPLLSKVNMYKLKHIIEFFKEEGFSMRLIYNSPRILCHKLATINDRLVLLRSLNYEVTNLNVLCKNRKHFDKFVEKIKESNRTKGDEGNE